MFYDQIVYIVKKGINIFFIKGVSGEGGDTILIRAQTIFFERVSPPPLRKCFRMPLIKGTVLLFKREICIAKFLLTVFTVRFLKNLRIRIPNTKCCESGSRCCWFFSLFVWIHFTWQTVLVPSLKYLCVHAQPHYRTVHGHAPSSYLPY